MKKHFGLTVATAVATSAALLVSACSSGSDPTASSSPTTSQDNSKRTVTLWLVGADTNDDLRAYLTTTFKQKTGATLKIEEQTWGDIVTKLTTSLPDANNTPDVTELGNTQAPTFTNVGAFADVSDLYEELGGDKLLPSFVEVGSVDGKKYALPYYFGSRYMFARGDVWKEAGINQPTTLDEFNAAVKEITAKNPRDIKNFSGFFLGGQDWRNGISWIFANGGDLAKKENGQWVSTLSDQNTLKGLAQLQDIYRKASKAPADAKDATPWLYINDTDEILDEAGKPAGKTSLGSHRHGAGLGPLVDRGPQAAGRQAGPRVERQEVQRLRPARQRRQAGSGLRGRVEHRHLGQEQEPGPGPRAAQDHVQRRLPADARQGRPRPGQLGLHVLAR